MFLTLQNGPANNFFWHKHFPFAHLPLPATDPHSSSELKKIIKVNFKINSHYVVVIFVTIITIIIIIIIVIENYYSGYNCFYYYYYLLL